ncbi:MAG: signal peptide peptidase SppA [Planctomycetota bacterium]
MSSLPPSDSSGPPGSPPPTPPGVPPQQPRWAGGPQPPARESKGVAFFVAVFLGILLLVSAGLNVLLLLLGVGSFASGGLGDPSNANYDEVFVAGSRSGEAKVLQIAVRGAIAEGANPLMGASGGTVSAVQRALRYASREQVDGLLLYIDSPGGGVTDSDRIYQMLRSYRDANPGVPVAALFGDMCASGGYYIAVAAEHVISRRTSISGSIGVIMSAWNFSQLAEQWGIQQIAIKSDRTPFKDMLSPTREMRPEEKRMLTSIVDELYDQFVAVVMEGRGLSREVVERAANGGIYTAQQAQELQLVDEIGGYTAALKWFEQRLGSDVRVVERRRRPGFSDLLFGGQAAGPGRNALPTAAGSGIGSGLEQLLLGSTGPRFLYFWQGGR